MTTLYLQGAEDGCHRQTISEPETFCACDNTGAVFITEQILAVFCLCIAVVMSSNTNILCFQFLRSLHLIIFLYPILD